MNFMSHAVPARHMVWCRGCGAIWGAYELLIDGVRISVDSDECACTCTDPACPRYEDWMIDPEFFRPANA